MENLLQKIKNDKKYSERTQISLSPTLKRIIETKKKLKGESLAEYIRNAIKLRIIIDIKDNNARKNAAESFVGSGNPKKHPEWKNDRDILNWQRKLRAEK